jgi:hypothetical protein
MVERDRTRRRPVRAIALLLLLQSLGLAAVAGYGLIGIDWAGLRFDASGVQETTAERAVIVTLLFALPVVFALLGAVGSLFALRWGWLLAELAQGICLGGCLLLYSEWSPYFIYPVMAYCIIMVLYLNSRDVRVLFHARGLPTRGRRPSLGGAE